MYVRMSGPLVSEGKGRVVMLCLSCGKPAERYLECPILSVYEPFSQCVGSVLLRARS